MSARTMSNTLMNDGFRQTINLKHAEIDFGRFRRASRVDLMSRCTQIQLEIELEIRVKPATVIYPTVSHKNFEVIRERIKF
jgi:hypothetical protein